MTWNSRFNLALEEATAALADGRTPDWTTLDALADTPERRGLVNALRLLGDIGATHGSISDADQTQPPPVVPSHRVAENSQIFDHWGRYRLVGTLGAGTFGTVYRGADPNLGRDVAIKLFHGAVPRQVKREGTLLASINHPNVVKVYDVAEYDGQHGLCMEFVDGRTYDDIVRADGPMHAQQVAVDGQAVCRALVAVHAKGILHRDVSARNVMRARGGRVVLMDLGAGLLSLPGQAAAARNMGTPLFMAPELFGRGASAASPRTDLYSLGVLLYFMATGRYPVEGKSAQEIDASHRDGQRVPIDERLPESTPAFVELVERATALDPDDRYESAVALLRDLNRVVAPGPAPDAQPSDPSPPPVSWVRATAMTLALLIASAGVSGYLTTFAFNNVIDLPPQFDSDSRLDKLLFGAKSLVVPVLVMGALLGMVAVAGLVLRIIQWPATLWRRAWAIATKGLKREEHATAIAQVAVCIGFLAIILVYVEFGDVMFSITRSVSDRDDGPFWIFRPGPESIRQRVVYRGTLASLLLLVVISWRRVRAVRLARGGMVPTWIRAAGVALGSILFILCQAPYKLMNHSGKPVAVYENKRCYVLGERGNDARLYCPRWEVPRVRTVNPSVLERCGVEESVFARSALTTCASDAQK